MIIRTKGDALYPECGPQWRKGWNFIAHIVNDAGAFGAGFAAQVASRFPEAKKGYFEWRRSSTFKLGNIEPNIVLATSNNGTLAIVHLLAQEGLPGESNPNPLRYDHLKECLKKLGQLVDEANGTIHMPKIGTGIARGSWACVYTLIEQNIPKHLDVIVYEH